MRDSTRSPPPRRGDRSRARPRPRARPPTRPSPRSARRSTTVDGVPGQLAGVDARGPRPRGSRPGTSSSRRASGAAARLAELWRTGARDRRRSAARRGTRSPSVRGSAPQASGKRPRGFGSSSVTPPGQQPLEQRARARAELGQRGERERDVEEHDRARLVRRAALQRVEPRDRRAGRPDRTRGRRPCRPGTPPRRRRRCSARRRPDQARPARPTTTRSMPGQVADRATRRATLRPRTSSATAGAWPAPTSRPGRATPRRGRDQPADDVEPVGAAEQRLARLVARRRGGSTVAGRDVGRVGDDGVERAGDRVEQVALEQLDVEPEPRGVRPRDRERARAELRRRRPRGRAARSSAPARSRPSPCRRRPRARPRGSSSAASTTCSVSGRGISTRASTARSIVRKPLLPRM